MSSVWCAVGLRFLKKLLIPVVRGAPSQGRSREEHAFNFAKRNACKVSEATYYLERNGFDDERWEPEGPCTVFLPHARLPHAHTATRTDASV